MNGLNTIRMMPARDRVAAALREAILSHQIQPGAELALKETAAQRGVSATPVREALQILEREGLRPRTAVDLACGTGSLTRELAERGYEMIGADRSEEMLAVAAEKCRGAGEIAPIFLHQSMEKLDLYGTIDACVCCLDSINYVLDPKKLQKAMERVYLFLMPGGVFLFDINSPHKLEQLDGQVFLDETEDAYCVWRAEYSKRSRICSYFMDIFQLDEETGLWERENELHQERAYTPEDLTAMLKQAGFQGIKQYGNLKWRAPKPEEDRIFFVARKNPNMTTQL